MELEGQRFGAQESVSKCFQVELTGLERRGGPFIAPQMNLPVGGVRDSDMSGLGAGHVWPSSLEPILGIGQVGLGDLTRVKG
jgi:hypothetical protein